MKDAKGTSLSFIKKSLKFYYKEVSKLPLVWKITLWHSLLLLLMFVVMAFSSLQFLSAWEEYEIRTELSREVVHISNNPQSYHSFTDDLYTLLYSTNGDVVRGYLPKDFNPNARLSLSRVSTATFNGFKYYYMDAPYQTPSFTGWVRAIVPATVATRHMQSMTFALTISGIIFVTLASIGSYFLIYSGLKPLSKITKTARDIGKRESFNKRIELDTNSKEIANLTTTFNYMLDRLERSFMREKQFTSDVSHELRTPISVIQAESDYGRNYISSVDEAKESFESIFKQCKTMTSMLSQLLELTRLDSYESIQLEPLNLSELLHEILNEYNLLWADKHFEIDLNIEEGIEINGNYILLRRAIANLLNNATKFTKSKIIINLEKLSDGRSKLSITDNGPGICKEDQPKLWDRFYQVDSSRNRHKHEGVGLGLHFVHMITQYHQGEVYVESELDVATTFTVIL